MADQGQLIPKVLSASTNGLPILISGATTPATALMVHQHDGTPNTIDVPSLVLCNTDTINTIEAGVVIYFGASPSDPDSIVFRMDLPPKAGAFVALAENIGIQGSVKIGVWAATTGKITVTGHVGKEYVST
jgi:hypothetical protein